MAKLGPESLRQLSTCKEELVWFVTSLVKLLNEVNDPLLSDIMVTCGLRDKATQDKCVAGGTSKDLWPTGRHNNKNLPTLPADLSTLTEDQKSRAVDIVPYPSMWSDESKFQLLGKYGKQVLDKNARYIQIQWGGDWINFKDEPHWQLV